jgi:hypothetical protein
LKRVLGRSAAVPSWAGVAISVAGSGVGGGGAWPGLSFTFTLRLAADTNPERPAPDSGNGSGTVVVMPSWLGVGPAVGSGVCEKSAGSCPVTDGRNSPGNSTDCPRAGNDASSVALAASVAARQMTRGRSTDDNPKAPAAGRAAAWLRDLK